MNRLRSWKMLVPPAFLPLALWMFVAVAGPGGIAELGEDAETVVVADDAAVDDGQSSDSTGSSVVETDDLSEAGEPADETTPGEPQDASQQPAPSDLGLDPGKSEDAPGEPAAQPPLSAASDGGQETADANGNGPANALGQNQ